MSLSILLANITVCYINKPNFNHKNGSIGKISPSVGEALLCNKECHTFAVEFSKKMYMCKPRILLLATICASLLLYSATPVSAQNAELNLSLRQAQEYAVEHSRTIANASIDVQKAEASKWQAIASMLPQISASTDYSNYFGYKMDLGGMQIAMPPYVSYGLTTSIAISGAQIATIGVQELALKMSNITLKQNEQQICNQTKTLYCSAIVTSETINLLEESLGSLERLHAMTQKSVDVGVSEQTDADQLLVQVTSMQNSITSANRSLEVIFNSIRLLLDVDANTPISLTDSIDYILDLAIVDSVLGGEFNIENNYSYQLLKANTDLAKKQISLTGWSNGPTLSVYHQYTQKKYFSDEMTMNMTPPNMLGISLKIPIFTSLSATSAVKDARLAYIKQLNTLADTEFSLNIQHKQLVYNLKTALDSYKAQEQNLDVARRVFDDIAKKYQYGVASSMEVINANTSLITAKSNYVQAILDILNAQISLEELLNI